MNIIGNNGLGLTLGVNGETIHHVKTLFCRFTYIYIYAFCEDFYIHWQYRAGAKLINLVFELSAMSGLIG